MLGLRGLWIKMRAARFFASSKKESSKAALASERWRTLVGKELRGKDPESLTWHTAEVKIRP